MGAAGAVAGAISAWRKACNAASVSPEFAGAGVAAGAGMAAAFFFLPGLAGVDMSAGADSAWRNASKAED
jgi:hypothetical protein